MIVIPAIDIRGGACVRLLQGDFRKETVYNSDVVGVARQFVKDGATVMNVIDLDGAANKAPVNREVILRIVNEVAIPVHVGGGIRTYDDAAGYLDNGMRAVILSTAIIDDPQLVKRLVQVYGSERVIVAVDVRDGTLAVDGWRRDSGKGISEVSGMLRKLGVRTVLVTDIVRDGTLGGSELDCAQYFIEAGFRVIAAGGIASLTDIKECVKRGMYGAVVGRALYEKKVNLQEACAAATWRSGLSKRIIPCLDIENGAVVKGVNFTGMTAVGDPVELAKKYAETGADELVFLDISATAEKRKTLRTLVERVAKAISIPFTVGGGVASIRDARDLLVAGADKVSICSAAVTQPGLVKRAAAYFGSQCIVVSVDAKRVCDSWQIYTKGGLEATGIDAVEFSQCMERAGAGELLVNSLDRDGTNTGFDHELLQAITGSVTIPVIASSGGGSAQDFLDVFTRTGVDAALGASIFHHQGVTPDNLKAELSARGVAVRR